MTFVSPREGYFAARKGYEAECRENGREPNWEYFDSMMLGLLGGASEPAEAPVEPQEVYVETPWPSDADEPVEGVEDDPGFSTRLADAIEETKRRMNEDF